MSAGPAIVYLLCLFTSGICAGLLARAHLRHRTPMLLWSAVCFVLLALNNLLVVLDILVLPNVDLGLPRTFCNLAAIGTLLYGFVWELER